MALPNLPRAQAPLTLGGDRPTNEWRRFFERLAGAETVSEVQTEIDSLNQRLEALEDETGTSAEIQGPLSVRVAGMLSDGFVSLSLQGDVNLPGPTLYYGTDAASVKGWHPLPESATVLPVVTGEVPPVFVYADDGSLIYTEI